jgi:hypothetical protein
VLRRDLYDGDRQNGGEGSLGKVHSVTTGAPQFGIKNAEVLEQDAVILTEDARSLSVQILLASHLP